MLLLQVCQHQGHTLQWRLVFSAEERIERVDKRSCGNSNQILLILFQNGSVSSGVLDSLLRFKCTVQTRHNSWQHKWINKKQKELIPSSLFHSKGCLLSPEWWFSSEVCGTEGFKYTLTILMDRSKENDSCIHFTGRTNTGSKESSKIYLLLCIRFLLLPYRAADMHSVCTKLSVYSHIKSCQCREPSPRFRCPTTTLTLVPISHCSGLHCFWGHSATYEKLWRGCSEFLI